MAKILYPQVITEELDDLEELEKGHRYSNLFQRLRMLRLLKSEECSNLGEAALALGYSWRQCQRWFASYQKGGIEELLKSRVHERGRQELVTPEALEDLKQTMKTGEIATISQADEFLRERHGIEYAHPDGVGQLLRRHKIKLKTGRPRRRAEPSLRANSLSTEHQLPEAPTTLARAGPGGEMVSQEFRRTLSNKAFESVALIQDALSETLRPYWETPPLLKRLTGYSWWVKAVEEIL